MKTIHFMGLECIEFSNQHLSLIVSRSAGPRILSLRQVGGENLLAELPDFCVETPRYGTYRFHGGHRLWLAPEDLDRTYMPDDQPVEVTEEEDALIFTQLPDPVYGIEKALRIALVQDAARVELVHTIRNRGNQEQACAAWAITQLRPGGTAVLPQAQHDTGLLPNRSLALWPYTDLRSPHIRWGNRYLFVTSDMQEGALKIGFPNPLGWLAYWLGGTLFVKRAMYDPRAAYYDYGSSSACYCNNRFLELETLGGMVTLAPGESVDHVETWEVYPDIDFQMDEGWVREMAGLLGLDENGV